jgi:hypothetical protein
MTEPRSDYASRLQEYEQWLERAPAASRPAQSGWQN